MAPFSYTCRNSEVSECVELEELAPFSYTCRNSDVSECVEFEDSAPFSYTCRNSDIITMQFLLFFDVSVDLSSE